MVFGTPPPGPWKFQCLDCKDDNYLTQVRKGIEFGGSKYQFLGGELKKDYSKIDCWFFSTSFTGNGTTMALPYTVSEARNWLADFDSVASPYKCNARLKLGFSQTHPCFDLTDQDIIMDDDVISHSGVSSGIMTDGCGLIHSSLAEKIPYAISSGISACERDNSLQREKLGLPLIVQIRLAAKKGLFKGCLIVTNDTSLCPEGKIVVRPSMKKASGAKHIECNTPCTLAINNTFEHASRLRHDCPLRSHHANLSRQLCLYLVHLGVPERRFIALMQEELERVIIALQNKAAAKNLIVRSLERAEYARQKNEIINSDDDDEEEEEEHGDDWDYNFSPSTFSSEEMPVLKTLSALHDRETNSLALKAWSFFKNGHDLSEPNFSRLMKNLQKQQLQKLKKLNLRVDKADYLVGVPDPYGVLKGGTIFLSLPCDFRKSSVYSEEGDTYKQADTVEGKVIVSKNPMNYMGDVRVLEAVYNEKLAKLTRGTNGGAIFFSTHGDRRIADEMGGGDYDGDTFIVLFNPADEIVQCVSAIAPYVDPRVGGEAKVVVDHIADEEGGYETKYEGELEPEKAESAAYSHVGTTEKPRGTSTTRIFNEKSSSAEPLPQSPKSQCSCNSPGPFSCRCPIASLFYRLSINEEPAVNSKCVSPINTDSYHKIPSRATPPSFERVNLSASDRSYSLQRSPLTHSKQVDPTGQKMLSALRRLRTRHSIGTLSNACMSFADSLGPESQEAKDCDHFLRILLDCAKTGERLPSEADFLYEKHWQCRPHYLETTRKIKYLQSQSVVGVLYGMITHCLSELNCAKEEWKMDKQMLRMLYPVQCDLNNSEDLDKCSKEIKQWEGLCKEYRVRMAIILNTRTDKSQQNQRINDMDAEYIQKFDDAATLLAPEFRRSESRFSNGDELSASRRFLACIVYYVTYRCDKINKFCWNLCSNELHTNKLEAMKIAEGVSPLATILPSMEPYLR